MPQYPAMKISRRVLLGVAAIRAGAQERAGFRWPHGRRAAVSLTFDDARPSQLDVGIPLLDRHKVPATFYLSPASMVKRLEDWKRVAGAKRHELGNHSTTHACTANYRFSKSKALEDFTRSRMETDLDQATEEISRQLGVKPVSFAYPCGQKFIGRGEQAQSYIPLVAKRFLTGRGYLDEAANDPEVCDLANLMGIGFDDTSFEQMRTIVETAAGEGRWVVLVGHDVGAPRRQTVVTEDLDRLCRYLNDASNGLWVDTVGTVARHVQASRKGR
jgi:peptidoglycan-N-acetylglucosamine deacetylase